MEDAKTMLHTFRFEGSERKVPVRLDEPTGRCFLDCPDLEETPIYTSSGYPWVSVVQDSCPGTLSACAYAKHCEKTELQTHRI